MKTILPFQIMSTLVPFLLLSHPGAARAQGTAFMYQGRLIDAGNPANGVYDMRASLYVTNAGGAAAFGPLTNTAVPVSNGLFTMPLDFGNAFDGTIYWLQIAVRTNGGSVFTNLNPRQQLTPAPYSIFATTASNLSGTLSAGQISGPVPSADLSGTYGAPVSFSNIADSFTGNGAGLTNVNAATLGGLGASNFWSINGNAGTTGGVNFIGTTDNKPLDLYAGNVRALRLILRTDPAGYFTNTPNVIGGAAVNVVNSSVVGGTIGGGGASDMYGDVYSNSVSGDFGTISGGYQNTASGVGSFVGGGGYDGYYNTGNTASGAASMVGGGLQNVSSGDYSTVAGGVFGTAKGVGSFVGGGGTDGDLFAGNTAYGKASVIAGGFGNTTTNPFSTVSGGLANTASGYGATIPGGNANTAAGEDSFAGGTSAEANHNGAFVWADDNTSFYFASVRANEFAARATGGVRFVTAVDNTTGAPTAGASIAPGSTSWGVISDRNAKKNFTPVDGVEVLAGLRRVPVEKWNYQWETDDSVPHIGPMAQDFKAAFYPGRDDKTITTLEFDGVELAAIEGLDHKLDEKEAAIQKLKEQNNALEQRLSELEALVKSLAKNQ